MFKIQPRYVNNLNNNVPSPKVNVYYSPAEIDYIKWHETKKNSKKKLSLPSFGFIDSLKNFFKPSYMKVQFYRYGKPVIPPEKLFPEVSDPFEGVTEEERNYTPKRRNAVLFQKGKLMELARCGSDVNCEVSYKILKDNKDFNELLNSKLFSSCEFDKHKAFVKLINLMENLRVQREDILIKDYKEFAKRHKNQTDCTPGYIPAPSYAYSEYEVADIEDYAKYLNEFVKNEKLSDDLKEYYIATQADKLDTYYYHLNFLRDGSRKIMDVLTKKQVRLVF